MAACVRTPGPSRARAQEVRTFGTTTVELLGLRDWLVACGVTLVGMESTGVYWRPVVRHEALHARARSARATPEPVNRAGGEAMRKACGVLMAMLPGKSWAPHPSNGQQ